MEDAFKQGETAAHLQNIRADISVIKTEIKEHNISDAREFAGLNERMAGLYTALKLQEQQNNARHETNVATLAQIDQTLTKLAADTSSTKAAVAKIYILAGAFGGLSGTFLPYVIHYFFKV